MKPSFFPLKKIRKLCSDFKGWMAQASFIWQDLVTRVLTLFAFFALFAFWFSLLWTAVMLVMLVMLAMLVMLVMLVMLK